MHILIITHFFPPLNAIASLRPLSFAKYFTEQGHRVTVITTEKTNYDGRLDLEEYAHPDLNIIQIPYTPLFFWKKKVEPSTVNSSYDSARSPMSGRGVLYHLKNTLKAAVDSLGFMLDHQRFWKNKVVSTAEQIIKNKQVDVILSTFSPASAHVAAHEITLRFPELKWVADYRDLWSQNHILSARGVFKYVERGIEKRTISNACHLTTVSKPLADDLVTLTKGKIPVSVIYNGYESTHLYGMDGTSNKIFSKPLSIVYTGTIYKGRRDPTPLLVALSELEQEGVIKEGDIRVEFYGSTNHNLTEIVRLCGGEKWVSIKGYVPYKESIRIQKNADFLLFLESNKPDARGVLTGKVFEYLIANKPILGVGIDEHCATGQLIEATRTGFVFGERKEYIKAYFKSILESNSVNIHKPDWDVIRQYSREAQSKRMLSILTDACNAR